MQDEKKYIKQIVRGIPINLMTYNRSLELCARMNYETENLDFIDSLTPGSTYYDLGACEGRFALYAAGKGLNVYAFEPERNNYGVLLENIEINNSTGKITPYNLGVGERTGKASMDIGQPWAGGHQKIVRHDLIREDVAKFEFKEAQEIEVVSLDDFVRSEGLPHPQYMKIDIDGSEMPFIAGACSVLAGKELKRIIFELDTADANYDKILSALTQFQFTISTKYKVPNEPTLYNIIFDKK